MIVSARLHPNQAITIQNVTDLAAAFYPKKPETSHVQDHPVKTRVRMASIVLIVCTHICKAKLLQSRKESFGMSREMPKTLFSRLGKDQQ
jgi:hypothetical protein